MKNTDKDNQAPVWKKRQRQRGTKKKKQRHQYPPCTALYAVQVNGVAVGKSFTFSIKFINININAVNNRGLVTTTSIMMSEFTKLFHRTLIWKSLSLSGSWKCGGVGYHRERSHVSDFSSGPCHSLYNAISVEVLLKYNDTKQYKICHTIRSKLKYLKRQWQYDTK